MFVQNLLQVSKSCYSSGCFFFSHVFFSSRRDPYDYPTHSRPVPREQGPYPSHYPDPPVSGNPGRLTLPQSTSQPQQAANNPHYHPSSQPHRAAKRQDVPPSPTTGRRGRQYYEATEGRYYRQASPGHYISPERNPNARERYPSPDHYQYGGEKQPEPRRKNVMIDAV